MVDGGSSEESTRATAKPTQFGQTIAHYQCEIVRDDGKLVALAAGTVMTLRGTASTGR